MQTQNILHLLEGNYTHIFKPIERGQIERITILQPECGQTQQSVQYGYALTENLGLILPHTYMTKILKILDWTHSP